MLWLEARAAHDPEAADLLGRIRRAVPSRWVGDERVKLDLPVLRRELAELARKPA
jgi:hypothetical protein